MLETSPSVFGSPLPAATQTEPVADTTPMIKRLIRRVGRAKHEAIMALAAGTGGVFYQNTPDRAVLENVVFPYYQLSASHQRILFVGCDWYTAGYSRRMSLKSFATIDPDPTRARYGAANHMIAPMSRLSDNHGPGTFDLVICSGVIGWGLNDPVEAERSFEAAWTGLRSGGHLVVSWNDVPRHLPFDVLGLAALRRFEPFTFPPLGVPRHNVEHEMRHTFAFFSKPQRDRTST